MGPIVHCSLFSREGGKRFPGSVWPLATWQCCQVSAITCQVGLRRWHVQFSDMDVGQITHATPMSEHQAMVFHGVSQVLIHIYIHNPYMKLLLYIYIYVYLYAYIKLFSFVISHIWKRPKWSSNFPCGPWGHWAAATVALLLARWMLVNVVKALPAPKLLSQVISLVSKWFQDVSEKTRKLETMGTMGTSSMQPKNRPT